MLCTTEKENHVKFSDNFAYLHNLTKIFGPIYCQNLMPNNNHENLFLLGNLGIRANLKFHNNRNQLSEILS